MPNFSGSRRWKKVQSGLIVPEGPAPAPGISRRAALAGAIAAPLVETKKASAQFVAECQTSGPGPSAPPQAVAAGYTTRVGGFEPSYPTLVTLDCSGNTIAPFYAFNQDLGPGCVSAGDYSTGSYGVTITKSTAVNGANFGQGFSSACGAVPAGNFTQCTFSLAPVNGVQPVNNGFGVVYGYGYFEAQMLVNLNLAANYYPTFWTYAANQSSAHLEVDIFEVYNNKQFGSLIVWDSSAGNIQPECVYEGNAFPPNITVSATNPNIFGMLYTPAGVTYYYNNVEFVYASFNTSIPWANGNNYVGNTLLNNAIQYLAVYFGTSTDGNWPATWNWIRIWQ